MPQIRLTKIISKTKYIVYKEDYLAEAGVVVFERPIVKPEEPDFFIVNRNRKLITIGNLRGRHGALAITLQAMLEEGHFWEHILEDIVVNLNEAGEYMNYNFKHPTGEKELQPVDLSSYLAIKDFGVF